MTTKSTKWQQNLPSGNKIYQMAIKICMPFGRKMDSMAIQNTKSTFGRATL
jgi:hypothetical protein